MNKVLINALVARIKAGKMTIKQVPIPYQDLVAIRLNGADMSESEPGES